MPDTTSLPLAENARSGEGGSNYVMWVAGGAGVLVLLFLITRNSSSSGASSTTAAGTSINAALGSIQEENLNLMGQVSQGLGDVGTAVQSSNDQLSGEIQQVNAGVIAGNQISSDQIGRINNVQAGIDTLTGQVTGVQNAVSAAAQQQNQYAQALSDIKNLTTQQEKDLYGALQYVFYQIPGRYAASWGQ